MNLKPIFVAAVLCALLASCRGNGGKAAENAETAAPAADTAALAVDKAAPASDKAAVADTVKVLPSLAEKLAALPEEPEFDIVTSKGVIRVKLYGGTPLHRDNFARLSLSGYYDRTQFHRVISGFMIQAGDPLSKDDLNIDLWGTGGPDYTIPAEIVPEYRHKKGALAAARISDTANPMRESNGSQFYIVQDEEGCRHLDGQYTVFGEVVSGIDVVDAISAVETDDYDRPVQPVMLVTVRIPEN